MTESIYDTSKVFVRSTGAGLRSAVEDVFKSCGIDDSYALRDTFIKVNGIDFKAMCYTDPEVLDCALSVLHDLGARRIRVMENCTQGNFTRLVFKETGYGRICKKYGAKPLFLDEGKSEKVMLETMGYEVGVNSELLPLIHDRDNTLYINIPKLKTHSMSTVTLGIKNQYGMIDQIDRIRDHNFRLHMKFVDIFRLFRPTMTMIDGGHAIFNGHYPASAHLAESISKLDLLISGRDTLAVDTVGSKVLGYDISEVEHLRLAAEAGLGCGDINKIQIDGELPYGDRKYDFDILMDFPDDLKIVRGAELCCKEGCRKNTETLIQTLYRDYGGRGGFTVYMGKGFDHGAVAADTGPVHLAGMCAVAELGGIISERTKCGRVTKSDGCNNLAVSIEALTAQMGVRVYRMTPHPVSSAWLLIVSKIKGSRASVPRII